MKKLGLVSYRLLLPEKFNEQLPAALEWASARIRHQFWQLRGVCTSALRSQEFVSLNNIADMPGANRKVAFGRHFHIN